MTNKYALKLGAAISSSALVFGLMAPAAFAADLEISGNGVHSDNNITVVTTNVFDLNQTNNTDVDLNINATAKTGKNTANDNTGGNVTIDTGNATSNVTVVVTGGSNDATVTPCGCDETTLSALISGNGGHSNNDVTKVKTNVNTNKQKTKTKVKGRVNSKAKTGKNTANDNTNGTVDVTTGNGNATVDVTVEGGSNTLNP